MKQADRGPARLLPVGHARKGIAADPAQEASIGLVNLRATIEASGARSPSDALPESTPRHAATQLFFRTWSATISSVSREEPPRVHVPAEDSGDGSAPCRSRNGVGIEPQYFERIFMMFQRLHTRTSTGQPG